MKIELGNAQRAHYQFEFIIQQSPQEVWNCLINDINQWWLDDFKTFGSDSVISLEANASGSLRETGSDGSSLDWYTVQMCVQNQSLYLVGYLAPDWGGPSISMLKLSIQKKGEGSLFTVSDGLIGNVSEKGASQTMEGWKTMFEESFKRHAEGSN
jgi:uncharacterized protein YndB with AHSA1/START domain